MKSDPKQTERLYCFGNTAYIYTASVRKYVRKIDNRGRAMSSTRTTTMANMLIKYMRKTIKRKKTTVQY